MDEKRYIMQTLSTMRLNDYKNINKIVFKGKGITRKGDVS